MFSTDSFFQHSSLLLQNASTEIRVDEQHGIILAVWRGALTLEQVQTGCNFMTRYIAENRIKYHLSDHTALKQLSADVQAYLSDHWFYAVERAGLRKLAVKLADDIFAQATVRKVNKQERYGHLAIEDFATYARAYAWLLE